MNHIMIAGHLGADLETRFTSNGQKVTSFRIASNYRRGGKDETIWWKITVWGDQFDKMMSYLKKGSAVVVWGELGKPEIYNDREGRPQISLNVTASQISFSPFGKSDRNAQQPQAAGMPAQTPYETPKQEPAHSAGLNQQDFAQYSQPMQGQGPTSPMQMSEDEIPF